MARILVVDDSIESRQLLRELLSWAGHDVFEADDGAVALERLRDHPVDLVVSDILMPVLSGPELVARMRALPAFRGIPVVFWTASYLEDEAQALAQECGAACVIMKSGDLPKTLERIVGALPAGVAPVSPRGRPDKVEPVPRSAEIASSRLRDGPSTRLLDLIDRIREISAASGPQAVLDQACRGARLLVASGRVHCCVDWGGRTISSDSMPDAPDAEVPLGLDLKALCHSGRIGSAIRLPGDEDSTGSIALLDRSRGQNSLLGVPFATGGAGHGVLLFLQKLGLPEFTSNDVEMARILANHLGVTLDRLWLLESIQRSEERHRSLLEQVPAMLYRVEGPDLRQSTYVSPHIETMLGCTPAEWMESARALWLEFLSPLDRDRVQAEICGEGGTRGSWDVEYRMQPRSGGEIWVRDTARIITRPDGSREIVGIARDITDWKAGEQALRRRARQDEALVRIAKMALSGRSPAVLSDEAVRLVRDTLETDSALLLERVPECEYAIVRASAGLPPGRPAPDVAPIPPGSQLHFVIHSASPVSTEDLKSETRFAPSPTLLEMGVRGYLGVGLGGGRGSLSVSSVRCRRFSLEDAAFLQSVAGIFSMGLQRERAEKQLSALTEQLQALVASTSLLMNLASVSDAATVSEVLRNTGGDDAGGPVSVEELLSRLSASAKLLSPAALSRPATAARQALAGGDGFVASSPSMQRLLEQVAMVSRTRAPVLLLGETGTGKERIARLLHENSPRTAGPFVPVDCCALAESVLDSELFGHAAGAFTGAAKARSGLIEAAAGGTLFLDEIGDITAAVQSKLLRVLQKSEVRRIGENLGRKIDVRFVAATNRDLVALVREKKFREDLYYRLNVVTLRLPPVRERREDIPLLLSHFLDRATTECGKPARGFSKAALHRAMNHPWPGNVREVENRIRSATILGGGERIDELDLFPVVGPERLQLGRAASGDVTLDLESAGLQHVLRVLESCSNDRRLTARSLGVSLRTLQYKLSRCRAAGFPVPG